MSEPSSTPVRIPVAVPGAPIADYEVLVGGGLLPRMPALLAEYCPAHRYAIITDERVAELYGTELRDRLRASGATADLFPFPAGEEHKNRESWAAVTDAMLAAGFGRDSAVVALGGGVTGDLAGFVAATYMRGIPFVQIPTTLLAMIDASVGGKTGVDTLAGKNLVGAFHPPRAVLADPNTLRTLPVEHLRAGLAEAVKHGAIADDDYFEQIAAATGALLAGDRDALRELIVHSVRIKVAVVARDEREQGPRKILNFGHTIGHAVEALSGYRLLHGEAVAIGIAAEARIGEMLGITEPGTAERLCVLLDRLALPTHVPAGMPADAVLQATSTDKKARAGLVEYALIDRIGSAGAAGQWGFAVPDEVVREVLG